MIKKIICLLCIILLFCSMLSVVNAEIENKEILNSQYIPEENIELLASTYVFTPCERMVYVTKDTPLYRDAWEAANKTSVNVSYYSTGTYTCDGYHKVILDDDSISKVYRIYLTASSSSPRYVLENGSNVYTKTTYHTFGSAESNHPHTMRCQCGAKENDYVSNCYRCNPGYIDYYAKGTSLWSSTTVYESPSVIPSTILTRFGYKFLGWSTSSTATVASYLPGESVSVSPGKTKNLYAVWEEAKLLDTNAGLGSFTVDSGTAIASCDIKLSNTVAYFKFVPIESTTYVFESTNSSGNPCAYLYDSSGNQLAYNNDSGIGTNTSNFRISYNLTADTTYYYGVKWSSSSTTGSIDVSLRRQYNVKFDANGGTGAPAVQTKLCGDTLTLSTEAPTKTGYTFLGWSTVTGSTDIVYSAGGNFAKDEDCTLYAVWKAEGTCGDNLIWSLDNSGLFIISGSGSMSNFTTTADVPWSACVSDIKTVVIDDDITGIGSNCFNNCINLTNITIPKSVTVIGNSAFNGSAVQNVTYGGSDSLWNKISVENENDVLSAATISYALEDFAVTYAATSNGSYSATKTNDIIANGEKADLSVVAKREILPGGPIGTEKYVPWEFLGWNTDQNATVALEEVIVTSDVTLYPIFKKELTYNFYHANNELLESKTITIYNADNAAKFTMPSIETYLDWEPVEWCNDKFYSEMSGLVRMFDINAEVGLQFSSDFYARYKRTTTLTYDVGDYSGSFNPYSFVQYYYGSGQKTSSITVLPEVPTWIGEPQFYGWAKDSIDGDVFKYPDRFTVSKDTTMYALWQERATTPIISVADNNDMKQVSMSCSMDGTKIYYTTDGTIPTPESNMYTAPITITGNEDVLFKAIAVKDGYAYSKAIAKDVILNTVDIPISSILPGYIKKDSVVTLSSATSGATIYYTTDGTVPSRESNVYSSPFTITETTEICTLAVKDGMKDSSATMFKYTVIDGSTPYITIETTQNSDNTLTVTVNITENSKAAGGSFNLIYDNSVLEIVDASKGNYIKYANPYIKKDYRDNSIRVVWAGVEELDGGGEILTATFKLLSTTKEQTLLSLEKAKLSDADANKLTVQSSDAVVLLSNNTQYFDEYKTETTVGADKKSLLVNLVERAEENGCLIIAVYNNDGRLVQWKPTDIITGKDAYTIPLDFVLENKQRIKVFVWRSLSNLKPISNSEEFIYE